MINNFPTTAHFCASPKKAQNADFYTTHTHQLYIPQLKQPISPDYLHLLQPYLLDSQLHWLKWLMQVQKYCILGVTSIPQKRKLSSPSFVPFKPSTIDTNQTLRLVQLIAYLYIYVATCWLLVVTLHGSLSISYTNMFKAQQCLQASSSFHAKLKR